MRRTWQSGRTRPSARTTRHRSRPWCANDASTLPIGQAQFTASAGIGSSSGTRPMRAGERIARAAADQGVLPVVIAANTHPARRRHRRRRATLGQEDRQALCDPGQERVVRHRMAIGCGGYPGDCCRRRLSPSVGSRGWGPGRHPAKSFSRASAIILPSWSQALGLSPEKSLRST